MVLVSPKQECVDPKRTHQIHHPDIIIPLIYNHDRHLYPRCIVDLLANPPKTMDHPILSNCFLECLPIHNAFVLALLVALLNLDYYPPTVHDVPNPTTITIDSKITEHRLSVKGAKLKEMVAFDLEPVVAMVHIVATYGHRHALFYHPPTVTVTIDKVPSIV